MTLRVGVTVKEGNKTRVQPFEGVVIDDHAVPVRRSPARGLHDPAVPYYEDAIGDRAKVLKIHWGILSRKWERQPGGIYIEVT